jgi:hypothetical protein
MAVVLVVSTLVVLLFPLSAGPFTATNGPATAFRAAVVAFILLLSITGALGFRALFEGSTVSGTPMVCSVPQADCPPLLALRC